jgi:hypothetical protein
MKNTVQTQQIKSGDAVSIEPGYYIWTFGHMISADKSETVEIQMKIMDWAGELTELFSQANTEGIHQVIQGLQTKHNKGFDTRELFKKLDQIKPPGAHDPNCSYPLSHGPADLEEMSTSTRNSDTLNVSATHGDAHPHDGAYTEAHQIKLIHPNFHQHIKRENPKEEERYRKDI